MHKLVAMPAIGLSSERLLTRPEWNSALKYVGKGTGLGLKKAL
jgi:hypothetical protein